MSGPNRAAGRGRRRDTGRARLWVLTVVVVALMGTLLGRLATVQLAGHDDYAAAAERVNTRELARPAVRGRILAADGSPLAANTSTAVVTIDPALLVESEDDARALIGRVAELLELPAEQLWGRTRLCGTADAPPSPLCFNGSPYQPVPIAVDVDPRRALSLLEQPESFAGIDVEPVPVRSYPRSEQANAAHLLGHLGRASAEDLDSRDDLGAQDMVGRAGLEQRYDDVLRGRPGTTTVAIDPRGVVTERLEHTDPVPGHDLVTHLDPQVQATAERALADAVARARSEGRAADTGAAVVLDVTDGAVLAAASFPAYSPEVWSEGVTQAQLDDLTDPEAGTPLVNRVTSTTYPPASTFKVVSMPAAISHGVDPDGEYDCTSSVRIGDRTFRNYESRAYGEIDMQRILEVSCDTVFYRWAYDSWLAQGGLDAEDGSDPYVTMARDFGLGSPTGVDLPNEASGRIPDREWKRTTWEARREELCRRAEEGYPTESDRERAAFLTDLARENCRGGFEYRGGDAVNFAIGQGDVATTPLQMAVVYAAVANGGTLWTPQVAAGVRTPAGETVEAVEPQAAGQVDLDPATWQLLREGLEGVVTDGSGAAAFAGFPIEDYPVAGKTGTGEVFGANATAWFASYGPTPDPRYVVLMVVGQGGVGGEVAAPGVRQIWDVLRTREPEPGPAR